MFDIIDLLKPRVNYPYTGSYRRYKHDAPQYFDYKEQDYPSKAFGAVINNLITTEERIVIRTMWDCGFEPQGFIVTQDGKMWVIEQVQDANNNNEAVRFLRHNPTPEFIISLIRVNNEKGVV